MKKFAFLIIFPLLLLGATVNAQNTATFYLRGVVSERMNVSINIPETSFIDLRTAQTMFLGSITLGGSQGRGYSVTIASQNRGSMRSISSGNNETLPYTLSFAGYDGIELSSAFQMVFNSMNGKAVEYPIRVNFPKIENMENPISAGVYEDILTVTISAA